jgi:hypothetical protein
MRAALRDGERQLHRGARVARLDLEGSLARGRVGSKESGIQVDGGKTPVVPSEVFWFGWFG